MPIITVETKKSIDERELQKTTNEKQTKTERSRRNRRYSERVKTKWFGCAFKLGFLPFICKVSLIFKSSLELALSIILKQRKSKHVAVECRCFQIWDLLSFLIGFSILALKRRQVLLIELELQLAQVNLYTRNIFKSLGIGSLYERKNYYQWKTSLMLKFSWQNSLQSFESLFLIWFERLPIYGNLSNQRQICLFIDSGH